MKILVDMNLSPDWVSRLAAVGVEAVHWFMIGDPAAPDLEVMQYAQTQGYIVFTNDLDFGSLLVMSQAKSPSVVQVRSQDLLPDSIGDIVIAALRQFESHLENGALLTIDPARSRVRILPIRQN